jgi:diguanylate cyclase (GGDEF)-like protein
MLKLQNAILEMIAKGEALTSVVEALCLRVEAAIPWTVCSVLSVEDGRVHPLGGPSLPPAYSAALDNLPIGPFAGSCGTAAYYGVPVTVTDIENDARWRDFKDLILPLGFKACWSTPIMSGDRVLATFAFYYRECRGPSQLERDVVDACVNLCTIALERNERVRERERLTFTDAMTQLPNRARFNDVLAQQQRNAAQGWGMLLVDVDNLKLTNDTFGHAAGDALIQVVGRRVAAIMPRGKTFRLGGDEFAVILDDCGRPELARRAADILREIKRPAQCDGHVIFPAASVGGAIADLDETPEQVRHNADVALYHGKERNRGQFTEYSSGLGTAITRRFRAIRDVSVALAENRIDAYYQPILRLDTREVVGFEALCRMTTPSGAVVSAANFHAATSDAQVASGLTERMLSRVAADIRRWIDLGLPFQHVGINLSAADFHAGKLQERLCNAFAIAGIPLKHIILEVTESVYLGQGDHVVADEIKAMRSKGLRVALDDFGTGFASLTHLLSVPVDIIKIDQSFVQRLVPGDAAAAIVEGVMGIANKLGIRVVAEGIETDLQADHLRALGCMLGQGYLFHKAVNRGSATRLLKESGQPADIEARGLARQA